MTAEGDLPTIICMFNAVPIFVLVHEHYLSQDCTRHHA